MKVPVIKQLSENREFYYALLLIILIPSAFLANTYFFVRGLNETFNTELTSKANLAATVIGSSLEDSIENKEKLGKAITEISKNSPEIKGLTIISFEKGDPIILATDEEEAALSTETVLLTKLAWTTGQPYTTRLKILNSSGQEARIWQVSLPITAPVEKSVDKDKTKKESKESVETEVLAVVNLKITGEKIDTLINKLEKDALIFTLITLFIIVLLLLNHFRFFGYARLFQRLKEVDEMKDNFISLASHELRTPITALKGYSSLAISNFQKGDMQSAAQDMEKVSVSAQGINELVNDLLDVSKIEQKRLKLEIQNVDITNVISNVVQELKVQADQKRLVLNYVKPQSPLFIAVDPQKLKQVLVNLVGNAIKYTQKGEVSISQEISGNQLKTLIKDTGIGIPAEEIPRLFDKFHRVQNETTNKIRGTGLGLWITKQLVEMMKGKILVESIEKTGTKVIIIFPLVKGG